ncbi:hypothetical protein [Tardiphaga sp.]|uniref:hypothetical protein n=1 Tax=Tardiphaga sp. TaxID=1926292 RepID=UPI0025CF7016|nr:hypothetical protein [Tardiphaga sp.]
MIAWRAADDATLIWLTMTYAPRTMHGEEIGVLGFSVITAAAHVVIVTRAAKVGRAQ